jgi:signal transduction histidine kinase
MFDITAVWDYQMFEPPVENDTREMERRRQVTQGLRDILTILNSNRSLDDILRYIIAQSCRLLDTPVGAIYRLDQQADCLRLRAAQGLDTEEQALDLPGGGGAAGSFVSMRQTVAVADTSAAPGSPDNPLSLSLTHEFRMRFTRRYRALLAVPLIIKDQMYGALILYYHAPHQFSPEELQLAAVLSDQAALAIENARLVSAVQGKAVLEERQRIARDLHDSVTQALYGISLYTEAAMRRLEAGDTTTVARHLRALQDTTLEALQEMRLLIFELRPPLLAQEGLAAALQTRLEAVEGRSNIETKLAVTGTLHCPAPVEQALYRIAQEALNNTLKHAHAQHVTVALHQDQCTLILEISDDGAGFDLTAARDKGGLGLRGMEERVTQLGGLLIMESAIGTGTVVRVEITL